MQFINVATTPPPLNHSVDWSAFKEWLCKDKSGDYARDLLNYAKRFHHCLFNGNLSEVALLSEGKRRMVLASLSALAKFLGIYDQWKNSIQRYGIKWVEVETKDKRIIQRLTKAIDVNDVYQWIKSVKEARPELSIFIGFMAITGLRLVEAVESYNLIIKLAKEGRLSEYYDSEKEVLEHYKFRETFLRKGKKALISFVPKSMVQRIAEDSSLKTASYIDKSMRHYGLRSRFSDLREFHGSIMTKHLNQNEIDFLHGRIGTSTFMANYYNPLWIGDLKQRVWKGISEILAEIRC
ncbi:MAG: hypothetical protein ACPLVJ_00770 [Candidatus Bathyarchaeales archaeon]